GDDVALVVANIDSVLWGKAGALGRVQQRGRVGLGVRRGVAAHRNGAVPVQAQVHHQRHRQILGLVGDDAPRVTAVLQFSEQFAYARKEGGALGHALFILGKELVARRFVFGVLGR